jgi:hypothetical protein
MSTSTPILPLQLTSGAKSHGHSTDAERRSRLSGMI